jgi:hypothetical protein
MTTKGKKKGRELEEAVRFIQESILKTNPNLVGTKFSIEMDKIVKVLGVRHEIDVYVKTLPDSRFEATWIFECKDWKKPIGKNEVMILAGKVDAVKANRGFMVGRRFTKDAEAQVSQDARLKLVPCTDNFIPSAKVELICTEHEVLPMQVSIKQRGIPPNQVPKELDYRQIECRLNGQPTNFLSYVKRQIDQMIFDDQRENAVKYGCESTHFGFRSLKIDFREGEMMINGTDLEFVFIPIQFWVTVSIKKIISKFELKGEGRYFGFEPVDDPVTGKQVEINIVQLI